MAKTKKRDPALERALEEAGGPVAVALFISKKTRKKISPQAVSKWVKCPPRRVFHVAEAAKSKGGKTKARDLCPGMFVGAA